jgi:predicted Zn-dependent protease
MIRVFILSLAWCAISLPPQETAPPRSAEAYRLACVSEYKQQNKDEALKTCEQGLTRYPDSAPLAQVYVSILHEAVSPEERLTRLQGLLQQAPKSPALQKAMGEELLAKDGDSPEALKLLASAAKGLPQDAEAHFFYGEAACFGKQDDVCVRELTRAHQLSPQNQYANMQIFTNQRRRRWLSNRR